MKRTILSLLALVAIFFVAEAQKAPKPIKLLIKAEQNEALQGLNPKLGKLSIGDDVKVNGEIYTVQSDKDGKLFVEVAKTKEGIYKASYPADVSFVEDDPTTPHIRLVPSQLYEPGAFNRFYMPLRAEQAVDNTLEFKSACGVVHIKVKGDAALNCLKIEDNAGGYLAGYFNLNARKRNDDQRAAAERLMKDICKEFKNVYFLNPGLILPENHEGSVDGTHLNDLGVQCTIEYLVPKLKKILKKYGIK